LTQATDPLAQIQLCPPLRLAALSARKVQRFDLGADGAQRAAIAAALDIKGLRKFSFVGELRPEGRRDWSLRAKLGATVVQDCAITLEPVTTRIDEEVIRRYLAEMPEPSGLEVEMPEDDTIEPLGTEIDPSAVALEALLLALPAFPRAPGVELAPEGQLRAGPKSGEPDDMDDRPKPFAALAALRDKLTPPTSDSN
jgi:uncharacterized metal-binding protein YceD (DUF177 family)